MLSMGLRSCSSLCGSAARLMLTHYIGCGRRRSQSISSGAQAGRQKPGSRSARSSCKLILKGRQTAMGLRKPRSIKHKGKPLGEILAAHERFFRGQDGGARADLTGADLSRADLSSVNLSGAILRNANLEESDLRRAKLPGADLSGTN